MSRGYFITFEGGEGTGKSTQLTLVDEWLRTLGHRTVVTREPGGTPLAEAVRALLLDPELEPDGLSEIFLLEAARRDHVERVIRPALAEGAAIAGFDNGQVVAIALGNGQPLWETRVAVPRGRTELERMVDIDADPIILDNTVYAVTYQGQIAALELFSGEVIWRRDMSSHAGLGVGPKNVYVTDDASHVWALDRSNSASMWRQSKLEARRVSPPAVFNEFVVVGDLEGYVHWLRKEDGQFVARVRVDSDGIVAAPVATPFAVYVYGSGGELAALQVAQ